MQSRISRWTIKISQDIASPSSIRTFTTVPRKDIRSIASDILGTFIDSWDTWYRSGVHVKSILSNRNRTDKTTSNIPLCLNSENKEMIYNRAIHAQPRREFSLQSLKIMLTPKRDDRDQIFNNVRFLSE